MILSPNNGNNNTYIHVYIVLMPIAYNIHACSGDVTCASTHTFWWQIIKHLFSPSLRYLSNSCSKKEVNGSTFRPQRSSSATKQAFAVKTSYYELPFCYVNCSDTSEKVCCRSMSLYHIIFFPSFCIFGRPLASMTFWQYILRAVTSTLCMKLSNKITLHLQD